MRKYLTYLAVPIAIGTLFLIQFVVSVARGPEAAVYFAHRGAAGQDALAKAAAWAGRSAELRPRDFTESLTSPGFVFWDDVLRASAPDLPAGGPVYRDLEALKDLAFSGSSVAVGYRSLAETERSDAVAELASILGIKPPRWIGAYISRLEADGVMPETIKAVWEREEGRRWDLRGGGLVLYDSAGGRVRVLRRGTELGRRGLRVEGSEADGFFAGWFCVLDLEQKSGSEEHAAFVIDALEAGKRVLASIGLPSRFPALVERRYGSGALWTLAGDFAGRHVRSESLGIVPAPRLDRSRTLDSPDNSIGLYHRLLVPIETAVLAEAPRVGSPNAPTPEAPYELRCGRRYIERRAENGEWAPWFVRGVNLGASLPGHWATEPPTDDAIYLETFRRISETGFDAIRVYTLLPPAFYRALALHNRGLKRPLYLFQGIWLDEDPPGGDLLTPAWRETEMAESDRCVDAVHGAASIAPREGKSWGEYRVDASPWLAAFLVGRELLPEEVEATRTAHPGYRWAGRRFSVEAGHPAESFLASWAEHVQDRSSSLYRTSRPVGIVSWPTLDPIYHPGAWDEEEGAAAPYHDRETVDLRAVSVLPEEPAGFFAAFHVYPNYPDFMVREERYASPDPTGVGRYGAYLSDLTSTLPRVPLIVAEFGLATGFGTAHIHPEGLDHGGLSEAAQARGLVRLFREIARRGSGGGMVFEWSDEWSKKTWTTEPFMIPYARHAVWHNAIDPEQNYGIYGWKDATTPTWTDSGAGLRSACDTDYFYLEITNPPAADGTAEIIELGLDVVPGETGQVRLRPGGPLSPQGSEFKLWIMRLTYGRDRYAGYSIPAPRRARLRPGGRNAVSGILRPGVLHEHSERGERGHEDPRRRALPGPLRRRERPRAQWILRSRPGVFGP